MGKFEETSSKGKKDIAECVREARYLTTQIIKLKAKKPFKSMSFKITWFFHKL